MNAYKAVHRKRAAVEADELDVRQAEIALRKVELQGQIDQRHRQESDRERRTADDARRADWLREAEPLFQFSIRKRRMQIQRRGSICTVRSEIDLPGSTLSRATN